MSCSHDRYFAWVTAEVFLFVLVGATVNINYLGNMGAKALLVIFGAFAIDSTYPRLLKKKKCE